MAELLDIFNLLITNLSRDASFTLSKYLKKFSKLKTNAHRMTYVYKDLQRCEAYPLFKEDNKSDTVAIKHRENGNECYTEGKYRDALDFYTLSILNAKSKEVLALAYANRTAALFKMNLYQECLTDIGRAFENGYPENLKPKLITRQKDCKAQKMIENKYHEPIPKIPESEKNSRIQNARNCVEIRKNEQYGRYVEATRNIKIGEILVVEPPYAAVVEKQICVYCHECFELCYNLIPCDKCTKALYCSSTCKDKAFSTYHKYECPILLSLDFIRLDFPKRLALKMAFISKDEWDNSDSNLETTNEAEDDVYRSDRFREISNLETHIDNRDKKNLLSRTAVACGLVHLIKNHTTFLQDCANEERFQEILLLMIFVCGINSGDINELSPDELGIYDFRSPTAAAVYSFYSMFNHSCWPNVSRNFHGSSVVLRAINTIKKGEQCFVVYGPNYIEYPREFRQNHLAEYQFFTCTCRACEENWPQPNTMNIATNLGGDMLLAFTAMRLAGSGADVDVAKNELQQVLLKARKAEKKLPPGRDHIVKDLLRLCYNTLGNVRRL